MARIRRITRRPLRQIRFAPAPRRRTGDPQPTACPIKLSSDGPLYTYEPLSKDFDQIRLLKLQPRCSSTQIEIEITHVPSSAPPAYEALSYVWGSSERTHNVTVKTFSDLLYEVAAHTSSVKKQQELLQRVQPRHLPISRNLFVALEHLRLPEEPRVLWIDAICINQDDAPERSQQVNKMGSIYSKARRVVLWLGEEADESTSALAIMRSLGEGIDAYVSVSPVHVKAQSGSLAETLETELSDPTIMAKLPSSWQAIKMLLERPCECVHFYRSFSLDQFPILIPNFLERAQSIQTCTLHLMTVFRVYKALGHSRNGTCCRRHLCGWLCYAPFAAFPSCYYLDAMGELQRRDSRGNPWARID